MGIFRMPNMQRKLYFHYSKKKTLHSTKNVVRYCRLSTRATVLIWLMIKNKCTGVFLVEIPARRLHEGLVASATTKWMLASVDSFMDQRLIPIFVAEATVLAEVTYFPSLQSRSCTIFGKNGMMQISPIHFRFLNRCYLHFEHFVIGPHGFNLMFQRRYVLLQSILL
jgi:hypothetical protein